MMRRVAFLLLWVMGVASAPTYAAEASAPAPAPALIARGAYLAKVADCAACHDAPDGRHFAGGLPINSPFGTIYGSNITPDPDTGIGRYTLQDFEAALQRGVARGGKRLYPAMPYASFAKVSDDDIAALYAYFMHGVPAVAHTPPTTRLPFPFNQRWGLAFWDWAFGDPPRFKADPEHDAQWNRGAYLVQGLGHCGACHTPRGAAYEERAYDQRGRRYLTGGVNDHWFAPSLHADEGAGIGRFSQADLVAFLKTGHGGGTIAYGAMTQAVEESLQYLSDDDAKAIAHYLKSLPAEGAGGRYQPMAAAGPYAAARERPVDDAGSRNIQGTGKQGGDNPGSGNNRESSDIGNRRDNRHDADATVAVEKPGAGVYQTYCAKCHQAKGEGVAGKFPALAGNPTVLSDDTTSPLRIILEGGRAPSTAAGPPPKKMPAFATQLNDLEIAQLLSYIRAAWGNAAAPVTPRDVTTLRRAIHR